jgi:pantothenate kinase type III
MKLRFLRKKRSNTDSSVVAKESLKTRIKLIVKSFEDISSTIIFAILSSSQNSSQNSFQKSVRKSIKKSIKKSVKSALFFSIKQSIKQSIKSIKKSIKKALTSLSNVNYFALLKISNDDEIDDDLLTDDEVKKSAE